MPLEKVAEKFRGKKDKVTDDIASGTEPAVTDEMPVVPHKVLHSGLPFYSDPECRQEVKGAYVAILRPLDADGFDVLDVVPTRKHYQVGQYLTWQLNKDEQWEDCFFRNPETGLTEKAWTMHVEFVGKVISEAALAKDRERIEKLEKLYAKTPDPVM